MSVKPTFKNMPSVVTVGEDVASLLFFLSLVCSYWTDEGADYVPLPGKDNAILAIF